MNDIRISVRNLVEFILRSGDIDNRIVTSADRDAMQAGSRMHRKIQKSMGLDYRAEVSLKYVYAATDYNIILEGRADGIITHDGSTVIDEIKCGYFNMDHIEKPIEVHRAQAMCYAFIYSDDNELDKIGVQMTYCNLESEEIKRFNESFDGLYLKNWFTDIMEKYKKWTDYMYDNALKRTQSIKLLEFPYEYRDGQKELAISVYRAINRSKNLYIQAPTGIGKTLSVIYPALKAVGEEKADKIFYLTAKTITRGVAEETYKILRMNGLFFKTVTITAKDKICILEKSDCNPDSCPYAKGHYDRINDAVYRILNECMNIDRETIIQYADKYRVCPFEMSLDISNFADGIICDYNYVFDPDVSLKRYFADGVSGEYLFLVDEAHNLVTRAREMYSAALIKEDFLVAKKIIKSYSDKLSRDLERCNKTLLELKKESSVYRIYDGIPHFITVLTRLFEDMENFLEDHREFDDRDVFLGFYFEIRKFLNIYDRVDKHYRIYTDFLDDGSFIIKLMCVDPSVNLMECLDKGLSTIFFSATLLPMPYYKELLSGNPDDYAIYAKSPFSENSKLLLVASDVSSKYTRRNETEFKKVAYYISTLAHSKKGNYIVFFPSYKYMQEAARYIPGDIKVLKQSQDMSEADREDFLNEFSSEREETFVGLCVMGGIFSEGIDLKEERLIGAVIVGTGMPMVCTEQDILKKYFDEEENKGFDYAYRFPGMNKVLQSAGRVIRTENDRGIILLLDERFLMPQYRPLFPLEWQSYKVVDHNNVSEEISKFWENLDSGF